MIDLSFSAKGRSISLADAIFRPFAAIVVVTLVIVGIVAGVAVNSVASDAYRRQLGATQSLFADNIRRDLMVGDRSDVYRKCRDLLRDGTVSAVFVDMSDRTVLCDVNASGKNKDSDKRGAAILTTQLFFDEEGRNPAGTVRITYTDDLTGELKRQSFYLLSSILASLIAGTFLISRRLSARLSAPIAELCAIFEGNRIESLGTEPLKISQTRVAEFALLTAGVSTLLEKLATYRTELVAAERSSAIARMTGMLAHDVRKPFSILRMGLGMLGNAKDPASVKKVLGRIVPEIDKAVSSVDGLIADVMEVGSTSAQLIQEPASPESLIEATLGETFRIYPKADIVVTYDFHHMHMVNVHVHKVGRVFSNIVGNAVQAMGQKGNLWFKTRERDGLIEFCLGNAGSCIPPESLPKLFDAFFTSGKKGGTGLGLAIAEKVIKAHGGRIWCESSKTLEHPDGKVEFFFTLPVAVGQLCKSTAKLPQHSAEIINALLSMTTSVDSEGTSVDKGELTLEADIIQARERLGRPLHVLVVDDEPIYRSALASYLGRTPEIAQAITVIPAANSTQALAAAEVHSFDLVITDVDMGPGSLDGFELVREFRAKEMKSLICVHSNRIVAADHQTAFASGADAFLPKPVARAQLLRLVLQAAERLKTQKVAATSTAALPSPQKPSLGKPELLVVDDNAFVLDAWVDVLSPDATVHVATSMTSLESLLAKDADLVNRLTLVVTDFHLDDGVSDGADIGRKLKGYRLDLQVLLSSDGVYDVKEFGGAIDRVIGKNPAPFRDLMDHRTEAMLH